jgi:hypothetical protein
MKATMASSWGVSDRVFCAIEAMLNEAASKGKITRCIFISRRGYQPEPAPAKSRKSEDTAAESIMVRLVLLPLEAHGYAARESLEHMLWEMETGSIPT